MSFNVTDSFREAIERLSTSAGAILVVGLAFFGTIRTAAGQDITAGIAERILTELQDPEFRDQLGPQQTEAVETVEMEIESFIADLPLALGLSPSAAAALWIGAYILGLVVVVIAVDTFGNERDTLSGIETEGIGWKVFNLFFGTILFGILVFIGLLLLVLPGIVLAVLLLFFPAAVVLDDQSVFGAFSSSVSVARENFLGAFGLAVLLVVALFVVGVVGSIVGSTIGDAPGAIIEDLFSALGTALLLAVIVRAYVAGSGGDGTATSPEEDTTPSEPEETPS